MTYEEWEANVHARVKQEPVWHYLGYRKALFLYDLVWQDCATMMQDRRGKAVAEQLICSAGSIGANVEEGYGRGFGKQRNWFFGVAIGSARESKGWYWRVRQLLKPELLDGRLALVDEVIALLITELGQQRSAQTRHPANSRTR